MHPSFIVLFIAFVVVCLLFTHFVQEYQDLENAANEAVMAELEGRILIYGQIIQLAHVSSGNFLTAKQTDDMTLVRLDKEGMSAYTCCIKFLHQRASQHSNAHAQQPIFNIIMYSLLHNLGGQKSYWKIFPFNEQRSDGDRVHEGDPIMLLHVKSGQYAHQETSTVNESVCIYRL